MKEEGEGEGEREGEGEGRREWEAEDRGECGMSWGVVFCFALFCLFPFFFLFSFSFFTVVVVVVLSSRYLGSYCGIVAVLTEGRAGGWGGG